MRRALAATIALLGAAGCGGGGGDVTTSTRAPAPRTTTTTHKPRPHREAPATHFVAVTAGQALGSLPPESLAREMKVMRASGVTSLRTSFYWASIEPSRGQFSFTAPDTFMTAAANARLDVLPVLLGTPGWATDAHAFSSPPRDPADFAAYATAVVGRYGRKGTFWRDHPSLPRNPIRAWQVWNEPDHLHYWDRQPFVKGYVRLARAARRAIKAADPKAAVVSAGFAERSWDTIAGMEKAGAKGVFDVIAVHPYTFEPANVLRIVKLVRAALVKAGEGGKPMWATEVTWSSGAGKVTKPLGFETTPKDQAARLARVFPLLAANRLRLGLQRAYWESWLTTDADRGNTFDYSGLREARPDGTVRAKPSFRAYRRFAVRIRHSG